MALAFPAISSSCWRSFSTHPFLPAQFVSQKCLQVQNHFIVSFPSSGPSICFSPWKLLPTRLVQVLTTAADCAVPWPFRDRAGPSLCPSPLVYIKRYMHILFISVWGQTLEPLCSRSRCLLASQSTPLFPPATRLSSLTPHTQRFLWEPASFLCPRCEWAGHGQAYRGTRILFPGPGRLSR